MSYFLGIEVTQQHDGIFISQKKYAGDILNKFKMENSKAVSTPVEEKLKLTRENYGKKVDSTNYKSLIGSLRYLTATRPNIVYGVGLLSRFMEEPRVCHVQGAKRILRYIKGTLTNGIFYTNNNNMNLVGYTDSDWAGDIETRKSTSGYAFHLGTGAISWSSKKQPVVALSTTEAEYIATTSCATQAVWLRRILEVMHQKQNTPTEIFCDNKSSIALCKNPVFNGRSKHIDIRFHKIRELVAEKEVVINYCPTEEQVADIFTKPLKIELFHKLKKLLGMINLQA